MGRYSPLGPQKEDEIFAAESQARSKEKEAALTEKRKAEESDIAVLAGHAVFRRWFKRTFELHGGMFNNGLKTDSGQAHGMTIYSLCADLSRTKEGRELVSEIVSEHFHKVNEGGKQ